MLHVPGGLYTNACMKEPSLYKAAQVQERTVHATIHMKKISMALCVCGAV